MKINFNNKTEVREVTTDEIVQRVAAWMQKSKAALIETAKVLGYVEVELQALTKAQIVERIVKSAATVAVVN